LLTLRCNNHAGCNEVTHKLNKRGYQLPGVLE
jgi:hypothetical protein